jgi:radical SAM superfamily enzyme YgiQ (UPF0313 family)
MPGTSDPKSRREIHRVAFIYLPTDFSDANRLYEAFQRRPPLGLQYLQAILRQSGIASDLMDGVLEPLPMRDVSKRIEDGFDLAGFYVSSMNLHRTTRYIQHVRENTDKPVIAGGPGSVHAETLLQAGADAVCMGEGEGVLMDLLAALETGEGFSGIDGIAYAEGERTVFTPARPLIENLDSLPFPLRDPDTVGGYYDYFNPMVRKPCISLTASRGCYYRCSYCYSHRFWRGRYRLRSVENVLEEIQTAHRDFEARYLLFVDDVFPQKPAWIEAFVEEWQSAGLRIPWMCILNPNSYRKDRHAVFKKLRDAGCNMISFGAQSGVPEILANVHRRQDEVRELYEAVRTANALDMVTVVTYIFGLPGEYEETAEATTQQMLALKAHLMDAHVLEILPGTEIAENFPEEGVTELCKERLEQIRRNAFRRFYMDPRNILRILWVIARKNPEWFFLFPFRPVWAALRRKKHSPGM